MPAVTYNFLPEGGTLASGVREPIAMVKNGVATYVNLDPGGVAWDADYQAAALPESSSPAWTKAGTISASVAGGVLSFNDNDNASNRALWYRSETVNAADPAILLVRMRITADNGITTATSDGMCLTLRDATKDMNLLLGASRVVAVSIGTEGYGGTSVDLTTYHVYEMRKVKNTRLDVYIDGIRSFSVPYSTFTGAYSNLFSFGSNNTGTCTVDITHVQYKKAAMLPSSSPTADFVFDSGSAGTVWDMSTIAMVENLFGEAGNLKYKYGAGETTSPTLSGSFQTAAQLTSESDPTGRYLRINVQLNGDGSQDAGWGGMQIAATTAKSGVSKSRVIGGV